MKRSIIYLVLIFICIASSSAFQEQTIRMDNETIEFTLLMTQFCGETEQVFRIERLNYTTGDEAITISYLHSTSKDNQLISNTSIQKNIKKYTQTKTGFLNITTQETIAVSILAYNQTLHWTVQGNCTIPTTQFNNTTTSLPTTNTTHQTTIQEEILNQTNTTTNTTTQHTTNTENASNTTTITQINTTQTDTDTEQDINNISNNNNTTNYTNSSPTCFDFTEIYTDKEIYTVGDKTNIQFYLHPISDAFTITYWIEDLEGNSVKSEYTTTNLNKKSYTFKTINQPEKAYLIKARFADDCNQQELHKLLVVRAQEKNTEQEMSIRQSNVSIEHIEVNKDEAIIHARITRGDTSKSVVTCKLLDKNNRRLASDTKIKLLNKYQELELTIPYYNYKEESIFLSCEGLGLESNKEILFPLNAEQKSEGQEAITEEQEKSLLAENNSKKEVDISNLLATTKTTTFENQLTGFSVSSPAQEEQNKARTILIIILSSVLVGAASAYKLSTALKQESD